MLGVPIRVRKASEHVTREEGEVKLQQDGRTDGRGTLLQLQLAQLSILSFVPVQPGCANRTDLHSRGWLPFPFLLPLSSSCPVQHKPSGGTSSASTLKLVLCLPPSPLHQPLSKQQSAFLRRISLRRRVRVVLEALGMYMLEHQLQVWLLQAGPSTNH